MTTDLFFHVPRFLIQPLPQPQLRKDPILDRWVIISTDRLGRPQELLGEAPPQPLVACPFCAGHEHMTPPPTYADPEPDNWQVRVIPNTYPAVRGRGKFQAVGSEFFQSGFAPGIHEVVIACAQHLTSLARLPPAHLTAFLRAIRERIRAIRRERPELYPFVFNNHKVPAGASLEHAHAQIVALPVVPDLVRAELDSSKQHFAKTGRCAFCDLLAAELRDSERVVLKSARFAVLAAFAARFPCELWLLPLTHSSNFEDIDDEGLAELGRVFWSVLNRLDRGLDDPSYNFILHTAPPAKSGFAEYHWHIEVLPRLTGAAGFEWGTGMSINPVPPEQAAAYLRDVVEG